MYVCMYKGILTISFLFKRFLFDLFCLFSIFFVILSFSKFLLVYFFFAYVILFVSL